MNILKPHLRLAVLLQLLVTGCFTAFGQESLQNIRYNNSIQKNITQKKLKSLKSGNAQVFVNLPFYDDFSVLQTWPSEKLWSDNYTYINATFQKFPPTIGVATFDALDQFGALYSQAASFPFEADHLTSQPIRLDSVFSPLKRAILKKDSVYLSFYYQPQGLGFFPTIKDSLVLEFHSPMEMDTIRNGSTYTLEPVWREKWSTPGGLSADAFAVVNHNYFRQVMIPITDSALYFKKGFQFRFKNYTHLAGTQTPDWQNDGGMWNVDLVYLNINRNLSDTIHRDIAFVNPAPRMLSKYTSMPLTQYNSNFINEMADSLHLLISNLDKNAHNMSYKYQVSKGSGPVFYTYDAKNFFIEPFYQKGYTTYQPFATPSINFYFPLGIEQKVAYNIKHFITSDPSLENRTNDTIKYYQLFSNYYSYDDGSSEAGYGLNGTAGGSVAYKFQLAKQDTLQGIKMYFNQTLSGASQQNFTLTIWNDKLGSPGDIIKSLPNQSLRFSDQVNDFQDYWLDQGLVVNATKFPGLIFYVGWTQTTNKNINLGFDKNIDSRSKIFFNANGNWQNSVYTGSLMMRPIVGYTNPVGVIKPGAANLEFKLFPNPVQKGNTIQIELPQSWANMDRGQIHLFLINQTGQTILNSKFEEIISVPFPAGIYFLRLFNQQTGITLTSKLIIS